MDLSDYVRFEIEHSSWALGQLIEHAGRLPQGAIDQGVLGAELVEKSHPLEPMHPPSHLRSDLRAT